MREKKGGSSQGIKCGPPSAPKNIKTFVDTTEIPKWERGGDQASPRHKDLGK